MNNLTIKSLILASGLSFSPFLFAAEALTCMQLNKQTGGWNSSITLKNQCGKEVDLRDSLVEFGSNQALSGSYWGSFSSLAYPENPMITNEKNNNQNTIKLSLTFPKGSQWWKPNTILPAGGQITIQFSTNPQTTINQLAFYPITTQTVEKGQIAVQFPSAPNQSIVTPSAVTLSNGGNYQKTISNGAWNQPTILTDVPYGTYQVSIQPIESTSGSWSGAAIPATLTVDSSDQKIITINYQQAIEYGSINLVLNQGKPEPDLATPILKIRDLNTNSDLPQQVIPWSGQVSFNNLTIGHNYQITTETLYGSDYSYAVKFDPNNTITVDSTRPKQVVLTFDQQPLPTATLNLAISGIPGNQHSTLTAKDNKGNQYTKLSSNNAKLEWSLPSNRQYQFSASIINDNNKRYLAEITPASLLLQADSSPQVSVSYKEKTMVTEFSPYIDVTLNAVTKWDSKTESMQPIGLLDIAKNSGVKSFHLAFITAQNGCQGTWAGYPVSPDTNGYGVSVFKQLKEQGVSLTVAMGGLSGTYLAQACENTNDLYNAYDTVIQAYQPDVIDFDVENSMQTNNAQLDRMMQAIKLVQQNHPHIKVSFTLPVMPYGLVSGMGDNVIKRAQINGLDDYLVNVMTMDYGPSFIEKTMGDYAKEAATGTFNQLKALYPNQSDEVLWNRIGVTSMIGLNDTMPLNFSLNDVDTLKQFADEKQLGLLSFWSINRDAPCSNQYVNITCTSANPQTKTANQTQEYEYSKRFAQ
jgi:chitinase